MTSCSGTPRHRSTTHRVAPRAKDVFGNVSNRKEGAQSGGDRGREWRGVSLQDCFFRGSPRRRKRGSESAQPFERVNGQHSDAVASPAPLTRSNPAPSFYLVRNAQGRTNTQYPDAVGRASLRPLQARFCLPAVVCAGTAHSRQRRPRPGPPAAAAQVIVHPVRRQPGVHGGAGRC